MAAEIFNDLPRATNANGVPIDGAKWFFYASGTTTPQAVYSDAALATSLGAIVTADSGGQFVPVYFNAALSYRGVLKTPSGSTLRDIDPVNSGSLSALAATTGASLIGFLQAGTGAVARTAQDKMRETVSAFDYMTAGSIAAVQAYTYGTDLTAVLQAAIDAAFSLQKDLLIPAGGYKVTGLYLPGRVSGGTDDRGKHIRVYGEGTGEPFVVSAPRGTVIKSTTDAPVLQDYLDTEPSSNGTVEVDHIYFSGSSTTPVIHLQSFYGTSSFHHNAVYQAGVGDGLKIGYSATVEVHNSYFINRDFVTTGLGAARVGIGVNYTPNYAGGLVTFRKNTSRGWLTGYNMGGGAGVAYSPTIMDCECSVVRNGIILTATNKATILANYLEGGDGGTAITNNGSYSSIRDNLIFPGFAIAIDDSDATIKGGLIDGNLISLGAVVNATGIKVTSSNAFGGYNKNVTNNSLIYTADTAGVTGILLAGTDPRVNIMGNSFDPRGTWTGAGSLKISDTSSAGATGIIQTATGEAEIPVLSRGAVTFHVPSTALTEADVAANVLTVPAGSYFTVSATAAASVNKLATGTNTGRLIIFRTTTANMTFTDSAQLVLAGSVNFTGPGTITFVINVVGGNVYAYEVARTVF